MNKECPYSRRTIHSFCNASLILSFSMGHCVKFTKCWKNLKKCFQGCWKVGDSWQFRACMKGRNVCEWTDFCRRLHCQASASLTFFQAFFPWSNTPFHRPWRESSLIESPPTCEMHLSVFQAPELAKGLSEKKTDHILVLETFPPVTVPELSARIVGAQPQS